MTDSRQLQGIRVLLVEDDLAAREALTQLLKIDGAEVVGTELGKTALDIAGRDAFDVLLTDLGLPDLPGYVVIHRIVRLAEPRPYVIVITGASEVDRRLAMEAGADVVLTKPLEWADLLERCVRVKGFTRPHRRRTRRSEQRPGGEMGERPSAA